MSGGAGFVSLVGAGPGDPELLTLRALRRLREADLVLNDALVDAALLELAPTAQRFFVGKRAGRHSIEQTEIHGLMIRAARRGQRVVRLKCGDPFVLGRGGEEALALEAAGISYEVVPGVSSAIAAPALAGIPVTHRGLASAFAVISGHAESAYGPVLDGLAPGALTLVVLMGLRERAAIAARLIARGWPAATPAAIVYGASHAGGSAWTGELHQLGAAPSDVELPGVLVIGAVVSLADQLAHARVDSRPDALRSPSLAAATVAGLTLERSS
jgi:uroporphyrin-III C-methyltransferase / precorrin-2 dehydrogenase / sirohydrochlorin ferrochelatase